MSSLVTHKYFCHVLYAALRHNIYLQERVKNKKNVKKFKYIYLKYT